MEKGAGRVAKQFTKISMKKSSAMAGDHFLMAGDPNKYVKVTICQTSMMTNLVHVL